MDELKTNRQVGNELRKNDVPRSFVLLTLLIIPVTLGFGVFIGKFSPSLNPAFNDSIEIDGYKFHFVSEESDPQMEGAWGYTYMMGTNSIWLNQELLDREMFYQLRRTCEHELLHQMGVGGDKHDMIEIYENQVRTPVCDKLMEKVKA